MKEKVVVFVFSFSIGFLFSLVSFSDPITVKQNISLPTENYILINPRTCGTTRVERSNSVSYYSYSAYHSCDVNIPTGKKPHRLWAIRLDDNYLSPLDDSAFPQNHSEYSLAVDTLFTPTSLLCGPSILNKGESMDSTECASSSPPKEGGNIFTINVETFYTVKPWSTLTPDQKIFAQEMYKHASPLIKFIVVAYE